jgi:hypothetical protein
VTPHPARDVRMPVGAESTIAGQEKQRSTPRGCRLRVSWKRVETRWISEGCRTKHPEIPTSTPVGLPRRPGAPRASRPWTGARPSTASVCTDPLANSEHESLGLTHALTFLAGGSGRSPALSPSESARASLPPIRARVTCIDPSECHVLSEHESLGLTHALTFLAGGSGPRPALSPSESARASLPPIRARVTRIDPSERHVLSAGVVGPSRSRCLAWAGRTLGAARRRRGLSERVGEELLHVPRLQRRALLRVVEARTEPVHVVE